MTLAPPTERSAAAALRNQRGVALLIVLIIVALLTITVTEFTFSVQIDMHRSRNALHALQAQLLARSGVNLAEGFLMLDDEPAYDAYSEDWWLQLVEFCKGLQLDESMRVRCRVRDESGKLNVNNTRGLRRPPNAANPNPTPNPSPNSKSNPGNSQNAAGDEILRDAMRCMFHRRGIDPEIVWRIKDYWEQEPQPTASGDTSVIPDFTSLEDFGATFGISGEPLHRLRDVMTAQPSKLLSRININTAPAEVLASVLNAEEQDCPPNGPVEDILSRRGDPDQAFKNLGDAAKVIIGIDNIVPKIRLFDVRSRLYRLEASALTNVDPSIPTASGIGQTLSVLVSRTQESRPRPGGPQVGPSGKQIPNWTLRPLDWQKEGGARLFRSVPSDENLPGTPDEEEESERNPAAPN